VAGVAALASRRPAGLLALGGAAATTAISMPVLRSAGAAVLPPLIGAAVTTCLVALAASRLPPARAERAPVLPRRGAAAAVMLVGALAAVAAPHLHAVMGGAVACAVAAETAAVRPGKRRLPWLLVVVLALVPVWWFIAKVAGPAGLSLAELADGPLSPAAQALLVPLLALGALALAGVPPLHCLSPYGTLLAPVGAAILVRLGDGAMPDGVTHWRPVLASIAALGVWWAALRGRRPQLLGAAALLGAASGGEPGAVGAFGLFVMSAGTPWVGRQMETTPLRRVLDRIAWAAAGAFGALALDAALRAEVTLATLTFVGVVVLLWRAEPPPG
jgi:hypothetical protein